MNVAVWTIVVCITVLCAALRGFSLGFTGQVSSLLGITLGALSARIFSVDVAMAIFGPSAGNPEPESVFTIGFLSAATVFTAVYLVTVLFTRIVDRALSLIAGGIGDALAGAVFGIFEGVFLLSIVMNVILSFAPDGSMLSLCRSDDANAPQSVLLLAPAVLGSPDAEELYHVVQLREARKIS